MKKITNVMGVFALALSMFAVSAISASASDGGSGHHEFESGKEFGQHVSSHAQMGHLGKDMNPGTHHKGFSPWAPGN